MVKLTILFRQPANLEKFEASYNATLRLMERIPGVIRRQANMVYGGPGGPSAYYRALELYFADKAALDAGLRSWQGEAAGRHLMRFAADLALLFFSEVYEEAGGSTPQPEAAAAEDAVETVDETPVAEPAMEPAMESTADDVPAETAPVDTTVAAEPATPAEAPAVIGEMSPAPEAAPVEPAADPSDVPPPPPVADAAAPAVETPPEEDLPDQAE